jgi:spermidine synthase
VPIVGDGPVPDWQMLVTGPASIGYELTGPGHALVIGGGGGRDIYTALSQGQRPVDVIELNEGIRATVDEDLGHLSGAPYSRDGVSTVIGDGRSQLASRDVLYDQIHIGFTDTLSGNAAQGFALTENNLYTVEAFLEYFAHLKPRGVLNVSRPLPLHALEPEAVPFAWGVNGIASVVASLLACVCYGVALLQALRAPWPQAS